MTWALETGRSSARRTRATFDSQRVVIWSGAVNRWWYHPGEVMPAPYPLAAASRPCVQGTQVQATFRFGRPFRIRWS